MHEHHSGGTQHGRQKHVEEQQQQEPEAAAESLVSLQPDASVTLVDVIAVRGGPAASARAASESGPAPCGSMNPVSTPASVWAVRWKLVVRAETSRCAASSTASMDGPGPGGGSGTAPSWST